MKNIGVTKDENTEVTKSENTEEKSENTEVTKDKNNKINKLINILGINDNDFENVFDLLSNAEIETKNGIENINKLLKKTKQLKK